MKKFIGFLAVSLCVSRLAFAIPERSDDKVLMNNDTTEKAVSPELVSMPLGVDFDFGVAELRQAQLDRVDTSIVCFCGIGTDVLEGFGAVTPKPPQMGQLPTMVTLADPISR